MQKDRSEYANVNEARRTLPAGFVIVRDGATEPTDIVYSWTSKEWILASSPAWSVPTPANVADCIAVARVPSLGPLFADADRRTYSLSQ